MITILYSALIGYVIGCVNPSWVIAHIRGDNLQEMGTGNLGATNTLIVYGKTTGFFVMFFDIIKSVIAVRLTIGLFPDTELAGVVAGAFTIVGHIFPFWLRFSGGKGVACLAGVVLSLYWQSFIPLLILAILVAVVANRGYMVVFSAASIFPIVFGIHSRSVLSGIILGCGSLLIVLRHLGNISRVRNGEEMLFRPFIKKFFFGIDSEDKAQDCEDKSEENEDEKSMRV